MVTSNERTLVSLFLIACATWSAALRLPDYITACKADNTLDACALKHGQAAIHKFINGDAKYRVPPLEPLVIPRLSINQGTRQLGLNMTILDCEIHGLSRAKFTASRMDLAKKHVEWDFFVPSISLQGVYKAGGRVLVLPITGNGFGNITLVDMKLSYKFDYKLENRKGEDYVKVTNAKLKFDTSRMYVHMANLFNGDKLLSDAMHRFLDENWREVVAELGPGVGDAIAAAFTLIFSNIVALVPYKHIFLK